MFQAVGLKPYSLSSVALTSTITRIAVLRFGPNGSAS